MSADDVRIAPARASDLAPALDLLDRAKLPREGLEEHWARAVVAHQKERLVGCAALELYGDAALLRSVAVDEGLQGRGLGQRLTRAALDLARERGVTTVYLLTTTAAGFFPRLGFRPINRPEVDPRVQRSVEFTTSCPASAQAMAHYF